MITLRCVFSLKQIFSCHTIIRSNYVFSKRCIKRKCTRNTNEFNSKHLNGIVCSFDRKFAFQEVCYQIRLRNTKNNKIYYFINQSLFYERVIKSRCLVMMIKTKIISFLLQHIFIFAMSYCLLDKRVEFATSNIWQTKNLRTELKVKRDFVR